MERPYCRQSEMKTAISLHNLLFIRIAIALYLFSEVEERTLVNILKVS